MTKLQIPIIAVMALIAIGAVGLVALRNPSDWWVSVVFSAMVGFLALVLLAAIMRNGPDRVFWVGAAVIGWGYAALVFAPGLESNVRPLLVSTRLLQDVSLIIFGQLSQVRVAYFETTGHSLIAMLVALVGGVTCRWLARDQGIPEAEPLETEGPSR